MEDFCTCEKGSKDRSICSAFSSDRHWCSICKKTIFEEPETEEKRQARKEFLADCHSQDDIIVKSFSTELEWKKYKERSNGTGATTSNRPAGI